MRIVIVLRVSLLPIECGFFAGDQFGMPTFSLTVVSSDARSGHVPEGKLVVEPSAAVPFAGLLNLSRQRQLDARCVGVVLTGGNTQL